MSRLQVLKLITYNILLMGCLLSDNIQLKMDLIMMFIFMREATLDD